MFDSAPLGARENFLAPPVRRSLHNLAPLHDSREDDHADGGGAEKTYVSSLSAAPVVVVVAAHASLVTGGRAIYGFGG